VTNTTRPAVTPDNFQEVYSYYGSDEHIARYDDKRRRATYAAHYLLGKLYSPRVNYGEGAEAGISAMHSDGTPALIIANHVSNHDSLTAQAALIADPDMKEVIRDGRLWTVARSGLFNKSVFRRYFDSRQLVPAFRPKDQNGEDLRQVVKAGTALMGTLVKLLEKGRSVAIFPEGRRNLDNPDTILKFGNIAAQVALKGLSARDGDLDLIFMGMNYGPDKKWRGASVQIDHQPGDALPHNLAEMRATIKNGLQSAVTKAVENY
jgi:1-acyl-sn-glycerol-3-phosphate acyltransferase